MVGVCRSVGVCGVDVAVGVVVLYGDTNRKCQDHDALGGTRGLAERLCCRWQLG